MGLELLTIISIAITVVTTAISFLLRPGDPGFEGEAQTYQLSDQGENIPVVYGRTRVNAWIAFADEQKTKGRTFNDRDFARKVISEFTFGALREDGLRTSDTKALQMSQHVFCVTHGIEGIERIRVDGRDEEDEDKWKQFRAKIGTPGQQEQTIRDFSPDRDVSAKFTHPQFLTAICEQRPLKNPQWYGFPRFLAYLRGEKTRTISLNNEVYSVGAARTYSPNTIRGLFDYLTGDLYGLDRSVDDFNLKDWYNAQQYYGQIMQGRGSILWGQPYPAGCNEAHGTNYRTWTEAFRAVGLLNEDDVGLKGDGSDEDYPVFNNPLNPAAQTATQRKASSRYWSALPTHLLRGEFHGAISTKRRFRDNIERFRETIPWTFIFEDHNGKIAIRYPDATRTAEQQSVFTLNVHNILLDTSGISETSVDSEKRPNQLILEYPSAANGMEQEVEVFPSEGSTLHNSLLEQDHQIHHRASFSLSGTNNIFHAHTLGAIYLLTGRRRVWQVIASYTAGLIEMGDVGRLIDEDTGQSVYVRVIEITKSYRLRQITLSLMEFEPCDYAWLPHAEEISAPKVDIPTVHNPENVRLVASPLDSRILDLTFSPSSMADEDDLVVAYEGELSRDNGATWEYIGRIDAEAANLFRNRVPDSGGRYKGRVRAESQNGLFSEWVESVSVTVSRFIIVNEPFAEEARLLTGYVPVTLPGVHAAVNRDGEWSIEKGTMRDITGGNLADIQTGEDWPRYLWGILGAHTNILRPFLRKIEAGSQLLVKFDDDNFALYYIYAAHPEGQPIEDVAEEFTNWQWVGEKVERAEKGTLGSLVEGADVTIGVNARIVKEDEIYSGVRKIILPGANLVLTKDPLNDRLTLDTVEPIPMNDGSGNSRFKPSTAETKTFTDYIPVTAPGTHGDVDVDGEWSIEQANMRDLEGNQSFTDLNTGDDWPQYMWGVFAATTDEMRVFLRKIAAGNNMLICFDDRNFALYYIYVSNPDGNPDGDVDGDFDRWHWIGEKIDRGTLGVLGTLEAESDVEIGVMAEIVNKDELLAGLKCLLDKGTGIKIEEDPIKGMIKVVSDLPLTITINPGASYAFSRTVKVRSQENLDEKGVKATVFGGVPPYRFFIELRDISGGNLVQTTVVIDTEGNITGTLPWLDKTKSYQWKISVVDSNGDTGVAYHDFMVDDVFFEDSADFDWNAVYLQGTDVERSLRLGKVAIDITNPEYIEFKESLRLEGETALTVFNNYIPSLNSLGSLLGFSLWHGDSQSLTDLGSSEIPEVRISFSSEGGVLPSEEAHVTRMTFQSIQIDPDSFTDDSSNFAQTIYGELVYPGVSLPSIYRSHFDHRFTVRVVQIRDSSIN